MKNIERFLNYGIERSKDLFNTAFETALKEAIAIGSAELVRAITEHLIQAKGWNNGKTEPKSHSTNREDQPITTGILNSNQEKKRKNNSKNSK